MTSGLVALALLFAPKTYAQSLDHDTGAVEVTGGDEVTAPAPPPPKGSQPKVGRKAAQKYMAPHQASPADQTGESEHHGLSLTSQDAHYLAVHIGTFVSDNEYKWGSRDSDSGVGKFNIGATYRIGEWVNSMDLGIRVDYTSYNLVDGHAGKLSFLPVIMFPDATSHFPLYLGAGIGPGIFTSQVTNESSISLDYQFFVGLRFFNVFENTGFFAEAGLKNHFLLLSDGQFDGTFVALGAIFSF
jgi:hypothetical protein